MPCEMCVTNNLQNTQQTVKQKQNRSNSFRNVQKVLQQLSFIVTKLEPTLLTVSLHANTRSSVSSEITKLKFTIQANFTVFCTNTILLTSQK